ncbi:cytosolic sulfotransferase 15-like [Populus alba x Populus x berolinensis]|uniref:Sulfotransferase n=1 Tax=Populus alba x Populus x berolinensis TaxID=444605 RepID=A0AAD6W7V5_9ROSI|nr:cytosolic sulfotransferase 15-like [Populus alba x Populus x berolinensis]
MECVGITVEEEQRDESQELLQHLPTEIGMGGNLLYLYQGFWCPQVSIKGMMLFQQHFKAQETDLILASIPKSGTTWLKALTYTIVNRSRHSLEKSPLLTNGPHGVVPFLEFDISSRNQFLEQDKLPEPRIFGTHSPYTALPCSVKDSATKIVYVCRNPLDMFISYWKFSVNIPKENEKHLSLEDAFDKFCQGLHGYGPFWDHLLGYWKASLERPDRVLFLKYEDMKKNSVPCIKKLAKFLGLPFSVEEEEQGLIEETSRLCSVESMKNHEATMTGTGPLGIPASAFLRKGKVGDSLNYLTPSMVSRVENLIQEKLQDSGLSFCLSSAFQNSA